VLGTAPGAAGVVVEPLLMMPGVGVVGTEPLTMFGLGPVGTEPLIMFGLGPVGVAPLMMLGVGPVGVAEGVAPPRVPPVVVPLGEAAAGLLIGAGETGTTTGIRLGAAVVVPPIVGGAAGVAGALGVGGAGETVPVVDGVALGCAACPSPGCCSCCALAFLSTFEQPMHRPVPSTSAAARFVHLIVFRRFMCGFSSPYPGARGLPLARRRRDGGASFAGRTPCRTAPSTGA
jgi:hypothetical protein